MHRTQARKQPIIINYVFKCLMETLWQDMTAQGCHCNIRPWVTKVGQLEHLGKRNGTPVLFLHCPTQSMILDCPTHLILFFCSLFEEVDQLHLTSTKSHYTHWLSNRWKKTKIIQVEARIRVHQACSNWNHRHLCTLRESNWQLLRSSECPIICLGVRKGERTISYMYRYKKWYTCINI